MLWIRTVYSGSDFSEFHIRIWPLLFFLIDQKEKSTNYTIFTVQLKQVSLYWTLAGLCNLKPKIRTKIFFLFCRIREKGPDPLPTLVNAIYFRLRQSWGQGDRERGSTSGARHPPLLIQRGGPRVPAHPTLGDYQKGIRYRLFPDIRAHLTIFDPQWSSRTIRRIP